MDFVRVTKCRRAPLANSTRVKSLCLWGRTNSSLVHAGDPVCPHQTDDCFRPLHGIHHVRGPLHLHEQWRETALPLPTRKAATIRSTVVQSHGAGPDQRRGAARRHHPALRIMSPYWLALRRTRSHAEPRPTQLVLNRSSRWRSHQPCFRRIAPGLRASCCPRRSSHPRPTGRRG